jgi:hypothetical protein
VELSEHEEVEEPGLGTVQVSVTLTNDDSMAAADYLRISIARDADNGSDNFAADAYLLAAEFRDGA